MSAALPLLPTMTAPDPATETGIAAGTITSSASPSDPTLYRPLGLTQTQIFALVWIVLASIAAWEALSEIGGWLIRIGIPVKGRRRKSVLLTKFLLFISTALGLGSGVFYAFTSTTMLCKTLATLMYSGAVAVAGSIGAAVVIAVWSGSNEPPRKDRGLLYFLMLLGAAIVAAPWIALVVTMKGFQAEEAWQQGYVCSIAALPKWHLAMWAGQIAVPLLGALVVLFGPRAAGSRRLLGRKVTLLLILAVIGAGCLVRDHFSNDTLMRVNTIGMSMGLCFPFTLQLLNLQPRFPRYGEDDGSDDLSQYGAADVTQHHPREKGGSRDSFELGSVQSYGTPHGTPRSGLQRPHKPEPLNISSALPTFVSVPPGSNEHLNPNSYQGQGTYGFTQYGTGYQEQQARDAPPSSKKKDKQKGGKGHIPSTVSFPGLWASAMPTEPNTPLPQKVAEMRAWEAQQQQLQYNQQQHDQQQQQQMSSLGVAGPSSAPARQSSNSRKYPPSSSRQQQDSQRLSATHSISAAQPSSRLSRASRASSTHSTFNRLLVALKPAGVGTPAATSARGDPLQQQQAAAYQARQQQQQHQEDEYDGAYGGVQAYGGDQQFLAAPHSAGLGPGQRASSNTLAVNMTQDEHRPVTPLTAYSCDSWEADVIYGEGHEGGNGSSTSSKRNREREAARTREARANGWEEEDHHHNTTNVAIEQRSRTNMF